MTINIQRYVCIHHVNSYVSSCVYNFAFLAVASFSLKLQTLPVAVIHLKTINISYMGTKIQYGLLGKLYHGEGTKE